MHEQPSLFLDLIIVLGSALSVATFFHYLKLPLIVGFIGAGLIIGPSGFNLVQSLPQANMIAEIGIIFLMFALGLDFSVRKTKEMRNEVFWLGGLQVVATIAVVSFILHQFLGLSSTEALLASFAVAMSSTAMTLKILEDNRDTNSPQGRPAMGLALAQDLAIIPLILLAPALTEMISPDSLWIRWGEGVVFDFVTRGVILIGSIWLLARFAIPFLLDKVMRTRSRELFFYMALFLCIGIAFVVNTAGLTLSIGAFIAGVLVSESPYGRQALSEILPLRDNFLGLFFLSVGMLLDLNFVALHLPVIFASLIGLILIKGAIIYLVMRARNYAHTVGLTTSLLTFNMGEFSFVLLGLGETHHLVSENTHQILLAVTILSLVLTPFLYKLSPRLVSKTDFDKIIREPLGKIKAAQAPSEINNHAIVIGYGVAGQNVGKVLKQLGIPCKALDVNYETVKKLSAQGHDIVFGDASKPDVLISLGLESAKLVVLCVTGETMIEGALLAIRKIRPDIKVIVRSQYLLEAKKLSLTEQDEIVIAEFETAIEILARTLQVYGVSSKEIHEFILLSRQKMVDQQFGLSESLRRNIDLPTWEALSAIRPVKVESLKSAESLAGLDIRRKTGASIVAIFREGLGTHLPDPEFAINEGDILFAIGDNDSIQKLEGLFVPVTDDSGSLEVAPT